MGLRKVSGELIRKARGGRSMDVIVEAAGNAFTKGALSMWENGKTVPTDQNTLILCKVLGCKYEHISVELKAAA